MAKDETLYEVDPNNEKLVDVKAEGNKIVTDYANTVDQAISSNEQAKNDALNEIGTMDANGKWTPGSATESLVNAQNQMTDFTISEIEREKEKAQKDDTKEQSGAYTDWQKQSNAYGVNAEQLAGSGLRNSGYAESSQVAMYNQYQARITAARESYQQVVADYNAAITNARIQNNATLAQIAMDAMQKRLEITLQFAMKNTDLLTAKAQNVASLKQQNFSNYMSVYNSILDENKLAEQIRQYNQSFEESKRQYEQTFEEGKRQYDTSLAEEIRQFNEKMALEKQTYADLTLNNKDTGKDTTDDGTDIDLNLDKGKETPTGTSQTTDNTDANKATWKKVLSTFASATASPALSIASAITKTTDYVKWKNQFGSNVDAMSILSLGEGMMNPTRLDDLVRAGLVEEYQKNGKLKYRKVYGGGN